MPRNHAHALVLMSTIDSARIETPAVESILTHPSVRVEYRAYRAPLDLGAEVFRYRVLPSGTITPLRNKARHCFEAAHGRRR